MQEKTFRFFTLICVLLMLGSCGGRPHGARNVIMYEYDGSTEEVVLENQYLHFRFLPETTEIILTNKANGMEWRSNPAGIDPLADTVTRYFTQSQFSMEFADLTGITQTLYSSEQSVALSAYDFGIVDGALEVNYTVGHIERVFVIPPAAPEERMREFLELMAPGDRAIITSLYRLYDINNLRSDDNRQELLSLYPDLSRRNVFVLRPDTRDFQREEAEQILAGVGYTYDDFIEDREHYPAVAGRERPSFNFTFRYRLDGRALVLDIPFDRIAYRQYYPPVRLSVLPYFGAGGMEDEGYLLVPDGSGALIRFNNGRHNQLTYSNFVYGWDEGLIRNAVINDNRAPFPVFGIQKNGNALVGIIENGAAYASVRADVAGRNSSWNNVFPRFSLVHGALMDISGRSTRDIYQYERTLPEGESITIHYIICEEDGYVGMAKEYRQWLLRRYPSLQRRQDGNVPIAIEIPGAVNKTQHILGIPFDLPLKLTSYREMQGMIEDFSNFGWRNVHLKLNGWFNRSVDHTIPTRVNLINALGNRRDFENMLSAAERSGFPVYPEVDFFFMRDKRAFDGFNLYRDTARYVSRERIQRYPFSFVWFGERVRWGKLNYVARPNVSMSMIDNFFHETERFGLQNVAFRNMGSRLAGDYDERRHISREASMRMRQDKFTELANAGRGMMMLTGHSYAAPWADFIVDMPLDDQSFGITDDSVPFYPIVLSGLVPYTGRAINLAEDYTRHLLKTIESGAGLYFSFMIEESAILQETKFRQFYANEYHRWVGDADALYKRFERDFTGLYGQAIVNHEIIAPLITVTTYADGSRVVVNASINAFDYDGRLVNAKDYIVLRGGR